MRKMKTELHWVDIYMSGRLLGIRNPYAQLQKAIEAGNAKRIGHGRYRIDRRRIKNRFRKAI